MHSDNHLYDELTRSLQQLNKHREEVVKRLEAHIETRPYPDKLTVYSVTRPDGTNPLVELDLAKATTLAAMANLKAAQKNGRK